MTTKYLSALKSKKKLSFFKQWHYFSIFIPLCTKDIFNPNTKRRVNLKLKSEGFVLTTNKTIFK